MESKAAEHLERVERALVRAPHDPSLMVQKALCLRALRRLPEALEVAASARGQADGHPQALEALGTFYTLAGAQRQALEAYDRLLTILPGHTSGLFNRAAVRRFLGDLAGAESDYDRVIQAQPADYEAYFNRSDLRVQTPQCNHIAELERLLALRATDWRGEVQLCYALAKEYEDIADYERSWQWLARGANLRRRHLQYDVGTDLRVVEWICAAFPDGAPASTSCQSADPIFIIGLPRSGSTLVERILGSHSKVTAAGELDHFALAVMHAVQLATKRKQLPRRELIEQSARVDFGALGADYLERARPASAPTTHFTDKMPLNYLYCGLIRKALPNARVVHVTRHPLAVCYAMFKTLFKQGYPFSYDLEEIGRYYVGYRKLMAHWHTILPGHVYDLSYEQLVSDQRGETQRLLEFCGLPFEDACLAFERNPAPSTTASASQVRRPLYDSSVALWRQYASQLEGLRRQLEAARIEVS